MADCQVRVFCLCMRELDGDHHNNTYIHLSITTCADYHRKRILVIMMDTSNPSGSKQFIPTLAAGAITTNKIKRRNTFNTTRYTLLTERHHTTSKSTQMFFTMISYCTDRHMLVEWLGLLVGADMTNYLAKLLCLYRGELTEYLHGRHYCQCDYHNNRTKNIITHVQTIVIENTFL